MPDPLRHVRALAEEAGARSAAGPAEARAARYIAEAARGYTHQVWLEPFPTFLSAASARVLLYAVSLLGGLAVWVSAQVAAAVAGVAAVCMLGQALRWIELGWLFRRGNSQNVVTVVPSTGSIRRRLIVVAHYDSAGAPAPPAAAAAGVFLLPVPLFLAALGGAPIWRWAALVPLAAVAAGLVLSLRRELQGEFAPAAGDEAAAGSAVALAAGEVLARAPLRHTEVWTVFTGARAPGMVGLKALLHRYGHMLQDADFLVLDRLGRGELTYSLTEGILPMRSGGGALLSTLGELAADHPEWGLTGTCLKGMETQAGLLLDGGYQAVTLLTREGGRPSPRTLEAAVRVVRAVADRLDRIACAEAETELAGP